MACRLVRAVVYDLDIGDGVGDEVGESLVVHLGREPEPLAVETEAAVVGCDDVNGAL